MTDLDSFSTPMMRQYAKIKQQYADTILFFRLGDFYEMFLDDAKVGAEVLDITLTARHKGKDGKIPMAGVPYHAADSYIAKLVKAGHKVAICEQVSDPNEPGLVEREVVRVVTPGTLLDEKHLEQDANNYVVAVEFADDNAGVAVADLGTGDFRVTQVNTDQLASEVERFAPREVILSEGSYNNPKLLKLLKSLNVPTVYAFADWPNSTDEAEATLLTHFGVKTLEGFGLKDQATATVAAAALLRYLQETQKGKVRHLKGLSFYQPHQYLTLDASTIRNLELFSTLREGEKRGSLWSILNHTRTAMGGRLLRSWILQPLLDVDSINARLDSVEFLAREPHLDPKGLGALSGIKDIERILGRLSVGTSNARDLVGLKESLAAVREVSAFLARLPSNNLKLLEKLKRQLGQAATTTVATLIASAIHPNPAATLREGNLIAQGYSPELDQLREISRGGKNFLAQLEQRERKATGIETLRVGFNKVHGYYIEVSKSKAHLAPDHYIRRQTLTNAERYITPELKEHEEKVLTAEEQVKELEYQLFWQVVDQILEHLEELQQVAQAVAQLDVLTNFAKLAARNRYVRPHLDPKGLGGGVIRILGGRHPVIEQLQDQQQFVPNDTYLDSKERQLHIITGANMAGKSTYIRQVALIVLMAQMGCFVPAEKAEIDVVDRIFTRLGASDQLAAGLSTFMVEMIETANILNNATDNSLVILDEVGRGTSTYDGISIAWSVAEHLALNTNTQTLFATHYHELTELADQLDSAQNFHLAVADDPASDQVVFLYQVREGGADRSYGIHVAQHAGLPAHVLKRANEILSSLEQLRTAHQQRQKLEELPLFSQDDR